jgi:hypothetical protein
MSAGGEPPCWRRVNTLAAQKSAQRRSGASRAILKHAQLRVLRCGSNANAVRWCREIVENTVVSRLLRYRLPPPGAAPGDAKPARHHSMQHLCVAAVSGPPGRRCTIWRCLATSPLGMDSPAPSAGAVGEQTPAPVATRRWSARQSKRARSAEGSLGGHGVAETAAWPPVTQAAVFPARTLTREESGRSPAHHAVVTLARHVDTGRSG